MGAGISELIIQEPAFSNVVARLDRAIQYSRDICASWRSRGVRDAPPEPVIGLAKGETLWRGMTTVRQEIAFSRHDMPEALLTTTLIKREGAGNAGFRLAPMVRVQQESTRQNHRFS